MYHPVRLLLELGRAKNIVHCLYVYTLCMYTYIPVVYVLIITCQMCLYIKKRQMVYDFVDHVSCLQIMCHIYSGFGFKCDTVGGKMHATRLLLYQ